MVSTPFSSLPLKSILEAEKGLPSSLASSSSDHSSMQPIARFKQGSYQGFYAVNEGRLEAYLITEEATKIATLRSSFTLPTLINAAQAKKMLEQCWTRVVASNSSDTREMIVELQGRLLGGGAGCSKSAPVAAGYNYAMINKVRADAIPLGQGLDAQAMSGIRLIEQGVNGSDEDFILQGLAFLHKVPLDRLNNPLQPMRVLLEILTSESGQWIRASIKSEIAEQAHRMSQGVHVRQQQAGAKVYEKTKVAMMDGLERITGITSQNQRGEAVLAGHLSLLQGSVYSLLDKKINYDDYIQAVLTSVVTRDISHLAPLLKDFAKYVHDLYQRNWHSVTVLIEGMKLLALDAGDEGLNAFHELMTGLVAKHRDHHKLAISSVLALKQLALQAKNPQVRQRAILGLQGEGTATEKTGGLLSFLEHRHELVRAMAVSCCLELRDLHSLEGIVKERLSQALAHRGSDKHQAVLQIVNQPATVLEAKRSLLMIEPQPLALRKPSSGSTSTQSASSSSGSSNTPPLPQSPLSSASVSPAGVVLLPAPIIRLWNVPLAEASFIGRADVLEQLKLRTKPRMQNLLAECTLTGLSGSGKTACAAKFCADYATNFTNIFWLRADSEQSLLSDLCQLAPTVGVAPQAYPQETARLVIQWLVNNPGWLVVFDNMQDPQLYQHYCPLSGGSVLVTTLGGEGWNHELRLGLFTSQEAVSYLESATAQIEPVQAQKLAQELGFQPLALTQAADYMVKTSTSYADYLILYQQTRQGLEKHQQDLKAQTPASSALVMQLQLMQSQLSQQPQEGQVSTMKLLRLCALLSHEHIPLEILLKAMGPDLSPAQARLELNRALRLPLSYSLIHLEQNQLSLNKLVQTAIVQASSQEEQLAALTLALDAALKAWPTNGTDNAATRQAQLRDSYILLVKVAKKLGLHDRRLLALCGHAGLMYNANGYYEKALHTCYLAHEELEFHDGAERIACEILEIQVEALQVFGRQAEAFEAIGLMNNYIDKLAANPQEFDKQGQDPFPFTSPNLKASLGFAKAYLLQKLAPTISADELFKKYNEYEIYFKGYHAALAIAAQALADALVSNKQFARAYNLIYSLNVGQDGNSKLLVSKSPAIAAAFFRKTALITVKGDQENNKPLKNRVFNDLKRALDLAKGTMSPRTLLMADIMIDYAYYGSMLITEKQIMQEFLSTALNGLAITGQATSYSPSCLKERIAKFKAVRNRAAELFPEHREVILSQAPKSFPKPLDSY